MLPIIIGGMAMLQSPKTAELVGKAGEKVIRACVTAGAKASKVSFTFIKGGIQAISEQEEYKYRQPTIKKLDNTLPIIENGLSIPASFHDNQEMKISNEISDDLAILKGQNEISFLSNSIRYFIESHVGRTGLDRGISYALQYDMKAVTNHLKANPGIRFPGYLLHQSTCLYKSVQEINAFYTSILNDGHIPSWDIDQAREEISRNFGFEKNKKVINNYIPFDLQLPIQRELAAENNGKSKINFPKIFTSDMFQINDVAHDALFILENELIANENLEYEVSKFLSRNESKEILIEVPPLILENRNGIV